jgi:hypothetical protein
MPDVEDQPGNVETPARTKEEQGEGGQSA